MTNRWFFRHILVTSIFAILAGAFLIVPQTCADNIAIANATACSGTVPGGTICSGLGGFLGTGGTPISLTGIENGSITLLSVIGTQTSPVYAVVNDTGSTITSFSLMFNGTLPSNQFIDCQTNGGFSGASCTISGPSGTVGTNAQYGPGGTFPAKITFTGLNIAPGSTFDIAFSSFANGASGSVTGMPEPNTRLLLIFGLLGVVILAAVARKRIHSRQAPPAS